MRKKEKTEGPLRSEEEKEKKKKGTESVGVSEKRVENKFQKGEEKGMF